MSGQEDPNKRLHRSGKDYPTPGQVRQLDPGRIPVLDVPVGPNLANYPGPDPAQGAVGGLPPDLVLQPLVPGPLENLADPGVNLQEADNLEEHEVDKGLDEDSLNSGDEVNDELNLENQEAVNPGDPPDPDNPFIPPLPPGDPQLDGDLPAVLPIPQPQPPAPQPPPPSPPPSPPPDPDQVIEVEEDDQIMAVSAAHKPQIFEGLSSENPAEFLRLFEVFCNIHNLALVPGAQNVPTLPAVNRFSACITGDAARWFMSLPPATRADWPALRLAFVEKYCNLGNDWAESVMLRNMKQKEHEPVEIFLNRWVNQSRRMGLDPDAHLSSCVDGLLMAIKTKVILAGPNNFDSVAKHAKLAEIVIRHEGLDPSSAATANLEARVSGL